MLAAEAAALEPDELRAEPGGVTLRGPLALLYRANLELGLALKVLVRVGQFRVSSFETLVKRATRVPWEHWLWPGAPAPVRASARKSRLYHTGAITERVREAIATRLGGALGESAECNDPLEASTPAVAARLERDVCTLSIDVSGVLLNRRGYRQITAKAPLREDLARALVVASGWNGSEPLIDPFCGAGTILIEAALLARRVPPGHARRFAFETAPCFEPEIWRRVRAEALRQMQSPRLDLRGSDRDRGAIEAAARNAERAGIVLALETATVGGASNFGAERASVVTNPPYGNRVGDRRKPLEPLYHRLGQRCAELAEGSTLALVTPHRALASATGLALASRFLTDHGGSKIYAFVGEAGRGHLRDAPASA